MRRTNRTPTTKRMFKCPECNRMKLLRPRDHVVSMETEKFKTRDGSEVELLIDTCESCQQRNWRKYFEPTKSDIRKVLSGMKEDVELSEQESLEDLL